MRTKTRITLALTVLLFAIFPLSGFTTNPDLSNYLINLSEGSEGSEGPGVDDRVPEIVVEGTTVHTLWVQRISNDVANLYYRRSIDLGRTWESAKIVKVLKDGGIATQAENRRLAADNGNVHICVVDYDYGDKGTGRIYYFRSQNNGASFESEKIVASTPGNYQKIYNSFIKVSGGKVIVMYQAGGDKKGTWALFSTNGGTSFTDTKISDASSYVADLYFDGSQMVVLYGYAYYSYGLSTGRVWVSVSQNGTSFTTNKISIIYPSDFGDRERSIVNHNYHYSPKIACSGNNIHVVFTGYKEGDKYSTFYARSTNNGSTFEPVVDIGAFDSGSLQEGSETVAAVNGNVYLLAAGAYSTNNNNGNQFYFLNSNNNGDTFSERRGIMNTDISHVGKASLPGIAIDPNDQTGKTLYLTGNWLFSVKSVDGGIMFSGSTILAPFLEGNIVNMSHNYMLSFMVIDGEGGKHWISSAKWRSGTDNDIFYRNVKPQPEPGNENKALYVEDLKGSYQAELIVVPSSESINFDSAMTAEVWIKFNPETQSSFNILAKVNGYDGYDYRPEGYHLGFRQDKGALYVNVGIETDKVGLVNWSEIDLNDNLWHHIAFTYDANGGLNNFKLYINGLLEQEQTLTGVISQEDGMLMIGSRKMGNSWYYDTKYHLDDVRLWNRALTQEELIANQTKKLKGKENGLKLFLNFDDTFKDVSGNGNDGIPVYKGTLDVSDFDPPLAGFEMYQSANEISFNNKTKNATSWLWDFGNTKISDRGNPKYTYSTPGEYSVSLLAKNANSVTAAVGHATIVGLDRIEPKKAGNIGYATITVFGGDISVENTKFMLRKSGNDDIIGQEMTSPARGALQAKFDIYGAEFGKWDVVVSKNNAEMILPEAFSIVQGVEADCWVNISGRGQILYNTWQTYTINYGNNGNVDAFSVPLWLAFTNYPGLEIEFVDFEITLPEYAYTLGIAEEIRKIDLFFETDEVLGQAMNAKVFPLVIPVIPANSSASVHFRVKTPDDVEIRSWMNPPWVEYVPKGEMKNAQLTEGEIKVAVAQCVLGVIGTGVVDVSTSAIPVVGAVWSASKLVYQTYDTPPWSEKGSWGSTLWNLGVTVVDCGVNLSGVGAFVKGTAVFLANMHGYAQSINDCKKIGTEKSVGKSNINAVSSFDPNEMIGPSGFSDKNYIAKYNMVPYSVLFENKSTATAPAHIVTVTDTLDLSVFDLSDFGFSSFGWGDTILQPAGKNLKEFSMDVDLRPEINLLTRVSGKLDTITGIVNWEFLSLNPETMNIEEDPFVGFLPPNNSSPEGEGFVSFSVGLKKELATNAEIRNKASIVFDANKPIITNDYLNTLDLDAPESRIYPLKETLENHFVLEWTGSDKGSGIQYYSIYVLENDTLLYPWLSNTTALSAPFKVGNVGSTYKFYSIATDNVSHLENTPNDYDAATTITVDVEEFDRMKENLAVWPNPVKDNLKVSFSNAPCGMYVVELVGTNGSVKHSRLYGDLELQNGVNINVADCVPGQYVLRVVFGNKTETRKIVVR